MAKYVVLFQGLACVEADSPEEAEVRRDADDTIYSEVETTGVHEVSDFLVDFPPRFLNG